MSQMKFCILIVTHASSLLPESCTFPSMLILFLFFWKSGQPAGVISAGILCSACGIVGSQHSAHDLSLHFVTFQQKVERDPH